jgi:hypothetical protein
MKRISTHAFDRDSCLRQVQAFEDLLKTKVNLKERDDILPFFKKSPDLSLMALEYYPSFSPLHLLPGQPPNALAHEYQLNDQFRPDLVVGDYEARKYVLVEFEAAQKDSIFRQGGGKATTEWSPRYEHAFSQLVDWFHMLDGEEGGRGFETAFGGRDAQFQGLIVIGRDQHLSPDDRSRLNWRSDHVRVDSHNISCVTFDEFAAAAHNRLRAYSV